jgi:hypothetical protein
MRGVEVVDKDGSTRKISIAFRPRDGRFEVGSENVPAAISQLKTSPSNSVEEASLFEIGGGPTDPVVEPRLTVLQQLSSVVCRELKSLRQRFHRLRAGVLLTVTSKF